MARNEVEVTEARIKEMGCPYTIGDPRQLPWLNGYIAGVEEAMKIAERHGVITKRS